MHRLFLRMYHLLPNSAQSAVASLRGIQLRHWRYGPETHTLVQEALTRDFWTYEQWTDWQKTRLAEILHRAVTRVPYYRDLWAARARRGEKVSWERLENWPLLEKETVRQNPEAFIADDCNKRQMYLDHTSGTTGTQLNLWLSKATVRHWYALFEARSRGWYGLSQHDRWGMLGGQLVIPVSQQNPPFWVWNAGLNQLFMSSYHLAPAHIGHYLDALKRYRVRYLLGYSSALYELAEGALHLGRCDVKMDVVITNAEPLYDHQRRAIEKAFQCPVRETYGMAEAVAAASECEGGSMHIWPEVGVIEVLEENGQPATGQSGELVCTSLINEDMPLIRYRVGDRVSVPSTQLECSCKRRLPVFSKIEGRQDDTLYTRDGRRIGRLDPVFKSELPIREAQIVQEAIDRIRVRYVPGDTWTPSVSPVLIGQLRSYMGDVQITLEQVKQVPRGANGKFRAVVCNLPPSTLEELKMSSKAGAAAQVDHSKNKRAREDDSSQGIALRNLNRQDLDAVAAIHMAAYPESSITVMGAETVRRYFEWQMIGPHSASVLGAFSGEQCVGYLLGGVFRDPTGGFLSLNQKYLAWRLLTHPWWLKSENFRQQLRKAVRTLRQRSDISSKGEVSRQPFEILALAVKPEVKRTGVGKQLMKAAEALARNHTFYEMQLKLDPNDENSLALCQALGWHKTRTGTGEDWRGEMKKSLL